MGFYQYPKVECSYEIFCRLKWSKEMVTINFYGSF